MNMANITLEGWYYDGRTPVAQSALLVFNDNEANLKCNGRDSGYASRELLVSPRAGQSDRFINLPDGGQYQCADHPFLDTLPQEIPSEGLVAWLEKWVSVAIISVLIIMSSLLLGYFYGLPVVAESMVKRIPIETEAALGKQALTWLDEKKLFSETRVEPQQRESILSKFNVLHQDLVLSPHIRLEFRDGKHFGPNAFAFPGGTIVITDQLVTLAEADEEILAVLTHEVGHVELRHSMRQLLQSSIVALAAATITADAATLSAVVTGLPVVLVQAKYSRDFETAADNFSFALLQRHNISPAAFARIMERLPQKNNMPDSFSFLSMHPLPAERIKSALQAGR